MEAIFGHNSRSFDVWKENKLYDDTNISQEALSFMSARYQMFEMEIGIARFST